MQAIKKKSMDELKRNCPKFNKLSSKFPIYLVLENIRSAYNVGSIFRTADALGIAQLLLCGYTPSPPHKEIFKTALGATESVLWKKFTHFHECYDYLNHQNIKIYMVEQTHQSIPLNQFIWDNSPMALVFGNEVEGITENTLQLANTCLEIPQFGAKHSLNISVAAGIVLWHLLICKK